MRHSWRDVPERGNRYSLALTRFLSVYLPRPVLLLVVYIVVFYFWLTAPAARYASREFLARALPHPPRWIDVYRHFVTFAIVMVDRFSFNAGRSHRFEVITHGEQIFNENLARGGILVTGHLGSFDAMRVLGQRNLNQKLHILLDVHHNAWTMKVMEALDPELARNVIDAGQSGPSMALKIQECVAQGGLVGIMADRSGSGDETRTWTFLGQDAPFPLGVWKMASVLRVPVVACFGIYSGNRTYELHFDLIAETLAARRRDRTGEIERAMERYCGLLESYAQQYPFNWFNFYDFWQSE